MIALKRRYVIAISAMSQKTHSNIFPRFIADFIKTESAAGIVMIAFAALALIVANSPLSEWYKAFIETPLTFGYGATHAAEPLKDWVKDILMVFFFLIVGMELKREMREGFLAKRDQILLPLLAAAAGMAAPALIFMGFNHAHSINMAGWAIPAATDIAFALCVLTLVSRDLAPAAKIFLLAIAIFDDLGAILIIAAFYNTSLSLLPFGLAIAGFGLLAFLNWRNVTAITPYILTGIYLWFCLYHCGIHTTIAGVAVSMAIADELSRAWANKSFDKLVLIAPPKMLGDLRAQLDKSVLPHIIGSLSKDLTHLSAGEIMIHLNASPEWLSSNRAS
jgi:NhaA family Na+:H+ antiporter